MYSKTSTRSFDTLPLIHFSIWNINIFDFNAIIILCHLSKRNVIDFLLFNFIEENLRNDKWLQKIQINHTLLGFLFLGEELKLLAGEYF